MRWLVFGVEFNLCGCERAVAGLNLDNVVNACPRDKQVYKAISCAGHVRDVAAALFKRADNFALIVVHLAGKSIQCN